MTIKEMMKIGTSGMSAEQKEAEQGWFSFLWLSDYFLGVHIVRV